MPKIDVHVTLHDDQLEWLTEMAENYALQDASKALRVVLDFAVREGNQQAIFETIRCRRC